jgi:hypothetical protein
MNTTLDAKRSIFSDKMVGCRSVYPNGGSEYENVVIKLPKHFWKRASKDIEEPYTKKFGIYDLPLYDKYCSIVEWLNKH